MAMAEPAPTETPLEAALRYAELGLRVIPIIPATKRPPFDEWQDKATSNTDTIRLWWNGNPRYGVGIATGQYGDKWRFVLDVDTGVDPKTGRVKEGDDSLADLEHEHGPLPDTVESQSGSGGRHLWFWSPVEVRNDQHARVGIDLDIRGEGGQVVAAPTIHPETGRPYSWIADRAPGEVKIAKAPDWLIRVLTDTTRNEPRAEKAAYDGPERPGDRFAASTTWPRLLEADGATFLGSRRDRKTGSTYELWARPGVDDHNGGTLYYGGTDLLKVFTPNWPGLQEGHTYTRFGYLTATRYAGDYSRAAAELAHQGDEADIDRWIADLPPRPAETGLGDNQAEDMPADMPVVSRLREALIHGEQITKLPAVEWLIPGVLQRNSIAALYGAPKSFKSFLAVDLSLHLVNGTRWRNKPPLTPTRVLYVAAEGAPGVGPRAAAWCDHHQGHMTGMSWITIAPSLFKTIDEAAELAEIAAEYGCDLVIIDTLARSIPGAEENSAKDLGIVVEHLDLIRTVSGATVLVVHHMGKNGAQGMRGSSALHGAIDTGLEVIGDRESVRMMLADQKNAESGDVWWWKPKMHRGSIVLDPSTEPKTDNEILALNALRQLHEAGGSANNGEWQRRATTQLGIGRNVYEILRGDLLKAGLVTTSSRGTATIWTVSPAGITALKDP